MAAYGVLWTIIMLSRCDETCERNGTRRTQEKFVHIRIQPSEEHAPSKYVGMCEGRLEIII